MNSPFARTRSRWSISTRKWQKGIRMHPLH